MLLHHHTILYANTKKKKKLDWTTDCNTVVKKFKHASIHAPILSMPNYNANAAIETDSVRLSKLLT